MSIIRKISSYLFRYVIFGLTADFFMAFPCRYVRLWYFRMYSKKCGRHVYIGKRVDLKAPWNITVGDNVIINKRVLLDGRCPLTIGNNVDIAQDSYIWTYHHDYNDDYHSGIGDETVIGDYVWICARSNILPGVKIGKGAVVGTCSVVTRDVPSMAVVGGIPAKEIAKRKSNLLYSLNFKPHFYDKL